MRGGAYLSDDKVYRYTLWRSWFELDKIAPRHLLWTGLNPSTAEATLDDPTVRKMCEFSRRLGYDGFNLMNLFAYRATLPKTMRKAEFPVGPNNLMVLRTGLKIAKDQGAMVIACWGAHGHGTMQEKIMLDLAREVGIALHALRVTKDGAPGHPLYIPYSAEPFVWFDPT